MTAPTWQELRDAGHAVFDQPERGLAVYATDRGTVVVAMRGEGGLVHRVGMLPREVGSLADALMGAEATATAVLDALHDRLSSLEAFNLIQRVKGGS
jgi:hypothetical protein